MTVEVQAAASTLVGLVAITTSHDEDGDDENGEESDRERSQEMDESEDGHDNDDYESNEKGLFN